MYGSSTALTLGTESVKAPTFSFTSTTKVGNSQSVDLAGMR